MKNLEELRAMLSKGIVTDAASSYRAYKMLEKFSHACFAEMAIGDTLFFIPSKTVQPENSPLPILIQRFTDRDYAIIQGDTDLFRSSYRFCFRVVVFHDLLRICPTTLMSGDRHDPAVVSLADGDILDFLLRWLYEQERYGYGMAWLNPETEEVELFDPVVYTDV